MVGCRGGFEGYFGLDHFLDLEDGFVFNNGVVNDNSFLLFGDLRNSRRDEWDGEVEFGMVRNVRNGIEFLPVMVEDGVEVDCCVDIGRGVCGVC